MRAVLATLLLAATACGSPAHGEPRAMSDADLGGVTAGLLDTYLVMPVILVNNQNTSTANAVGSRNVASTAISNVTVKNLINLAPTDTIGQLPAVVLNAPLNSGAGGPTVAMPMTSGMPAVAPQAPIWVPWAAELRPQLGLR